MFNKITSTLRDLLVDTNQFDFVARVGLGRSQNNKIDLLVGSEEDNLSHNLSQIEHTLAERWPQIKTSVSDDAIRFGLNTELGGIAVCNSTEFIERIQEWIRGENLLGQHRPWALGFWVPEALCGDLATAEILYDINDVCLEAKKLLMSYPESLSQSISAICIEEITQKLPKIVTLDKESSRVEQALCVAGVITSLVRLAFARSRHYLRGFQSLDEQAKALRKEDLALYELTAQLARGQRLESLPTEIKKYL